MERRDNRPLHQDLALGSRQLVDELPLYRAIHNDVSGLVDANRPTGIRRARGSSGRAFINMPGDNAAIPDRIGIAWFPLIPAIQLIQPGVPEVHAHLGGRVQVDTPIDELDVTELSQTGDIEKRQRVVKHEHRAMTIVAAQRKTRPDKREIALWRYIRTKPITPRSE